MTMPRAVPDYRHSRKRPRHQARQVEALFALIDQVLELEADDAGVLRAVLHDVKLRER